MILKDLTEATLIQRYKRFLADVRMPDGEILTAHCPNPGSMIGLKEPGLKVLLSHSKNPKRKLPWTMQFVLTQNSIVMVESALANKLFHEAFGALHFDSLGHLNHARPEHTFLDSRFDFLLTSELFDPVAQPSKIESHSHCLVEVKSTTYLGDDNESALFPDAKTERGRKHLRTLGQGIEIGFSALQFYVVARSDASVFKPADHIDAAYGAALREAREQGVQILAHRLAFERTTTGEHMYDLQLKIGQALPVVL
jgi:sugar fermentation stimulation protein A